MLKIKSKIENKLILIEEGIRLSKERTKPKGKNMICDYKPRGFKQEKTLFTWIQFIRQNLSMILQNALKYD